MKKLNYACAVFLLLTMGKASAQTVKNVRFTINAGVAGRKSISPYVYGTNDRYPFALSKRMGGNRITGYNWENNASNAGFDLEHSSDDYVPWYYGTPPEEYDVPGSAVSSFHNMSLAQGAYSLITLQLAGYVARDKNGTVSISESAPGSRWLNVVTRKNGPLLLNPNRSDNFVYMDEQVNFLINKFGRSNTATGIRGYSLDNEPCLWFHTHSRLWGPTGVGAKYLLQKGIETAKMVKDLDPTAEIFGPALWGYSAYQTLQDAPDWQTERQRGQYQMYLHYYLDSMRIHSQRENRRLLDVLDLHWYPAEHRDYGGANPFNDHNDPNSVAARLEMSRSLWDNTYNENSWVRDASNGTIFPALPSLKGVIDQWYPGTKLAITEYCYGGTSHVSGVIAQADALGAFGRNDVYLATYWGAVTGYIKSGFDLYCNYDGQGGRYGNTSLSAETDNRTLSAVYASIQGNSDAQLHTMAINRSQTETLSATISLAGGRTYRSARVYAVNQNSQDVKRLDDVRQITGNSFVVSIPPMTVYHLVLSETDLTIYPYIQNARVNPTAGYNDGTATLTVSATITDGDNDMLPPTADLSPIGGSTTAVMNRNGNNYSISYLIAAGTPSGMKDIVIRATDQAGHDSHTTLPFHVITNVSADVIWDGDIIRGGIGEILMDPNDQSGQGVANIERRTTGGNQQPGSLYLRFKHDVNNWNVLVWRLDADPAGAKDISEHGYIEFYIKSNAQPFADIDLTLTDANGMNSSNMLRLKAAGYISSYNSSQFTRVKIPIEDFIKGSAFDASSLWQLSFHCNSAQEGFEVWIDDIRAVPFDNPAVMPLITNAQITPAAAFADGSTSIRISANVTDPNNDLRTVHADLSTLGLNNRNAMTVDNGNQYQYSFILPATATAGNHTITVTAADAASYTADASLNFRVYSRASSDMIWDGDNKYPGRLLEASNSNTSLTISNTGGNKAPKHMLIHLQPQGNDPWAAVTWDLSDNSEIQTLDLREKRNLNFSVKVDNPAANPNFDLMIYLKDPNAESSNPVLLKRNGYLTSFNGNYQDVRIPLDDLWRNSAINKSRVAWIGFLAEALPAAGVTLHIDDIFVSGSAAADVPIVTTAASCATQGKIEITTVQASQQTMEFFLNGISNGSNKIWNSVPAGTHEVRISGANGFTYVEMVTVGGSNPLAITGTTDDEQGNIDLSVTNGSGRYGYIWSHGKTTQDLTGLTSGTYSVTVIDLASGCFGKASFEVKRPVSSGAPLRIYPNPASGECRVQYQIEQDGNKEIVLQIFDVSGRQVHRMPLQKSSGEITLRVPQLSGGSYILVIGSGKNSLRSYLQLK